MKNENNTKFLHNNDEFSLKSHKVESYNTENKYFKLNLHLYINY
jgi:hypothetical protein